MDPRPTTLVATPPRFGHVTTWVRNTRIPCDTVGDLPPRARFHEDLRDAPAMLRDDAIGVVTDPLNLLILGTSLGGSLALRPEVDGDVRAFVEEHPERWGGATKAIGRLGEAPVQVPVLLGVYGWSAVGEDEALHAFSRSAISAYTLTGVSTLAVKGIADTDRPSDEWNGGRWGFSSFHAASTFSMGAVVEEHYGTATALPVYAVAGLVSWSRIDDRDHDLSDVVFGAALGYVIGKSVARNHLEDDPRVRIAPWVHPSENATGLSWTLDF